MRRGDLYRVRHPGGGDPKRSRVFAVVGRQTVIDSKFSSVVCSPVLSRRDGLATQVDVGIDEGLKHDSSIHCDALVSVRKSSLTDYVGRLSGQKIEELAHALRVALAIE